jgi:hypothetical protein
MHIFGTANPLTNHPANVSLVCQRANSVPLPQQRDRLARGRGDDVRFLPTKFRSAFGTDPRMPYSVLLELPADG